MMFPKSKQTKKHTVRDEKKLSVKEKSAFIAKINEISKGKCQVCLDNSTDDYHHSIYGSFGADKDDRTLVAICRECHHTIHHSRNGQGRTLRNKAIPIGLANWKAFKKKGNKFGAKKTVITFQSKEYEFDSKAEANHFIELCTRLKRFEIEKLSMQPEFILSEGYTIATDKTQSGKSKVSGMKYTPDFKYYENGKLVIVEVKGQKTEAYTMRFKLFLSIAYTKYKVDTFIEIVDGKATRYECASVNLNKVG